jgi:hypothetical protein
MPGSRNVHEVEHGAADAFIGERLDRRQLGKGYCFRDSEQQIGLRTRI